MVRTSPDFQHKSLEIIKPENKFVRKLLNRDVGSSVSSDHVVSDRTASSFRVYYGDLSGSVPFLWETTPGTPKHPSLDTSIPPLTPPPSYYFKGKPSSSSRRTSRSSRLLQILFSGSKSAAVVKSSASESLTSSSSSPSSSSSLWSWSISPARTQSRLSTPGSSFDSQGNHHREVEEEGVGSPTSTLCFAVSRSKHRGCHAW